jgi:hypothetical protein
MEEIKRARKARQSHCPAKNEPGHQSQDHRRDESPLDQSQSKEGCIIELVKRGASPSIRASVSR